MNQPHRQHSLFEFLVVGALILVAIWPAFSWSFSGALALLHGVALGAFYLILRLMTGRYRRWMGRIIFVASVLLLLADITVLNISGLHINPFVISVLTQPGILAELNIPFGLIIGSGTAIVAGGIAAAGLFQKPAFTLRGRDLAVTLVVSITLSQLLYGSLFYRGDPVIEDTRRKLPFFTAPHTYYNLKFFGHFISRRSDNPFALSDGTKTSDSPAPIQSPPFKGATKNVLMIVADSVRSLELEQSPQLAPNIRRLSKSASLNYNHYSVSNCTHFSFYSMFTGKLANNFGEARRQKQTQGILTRFAASGFQLSSAESMSLDWYNTAQIIFPSNLHRSIASAEGYQARDREVTQITKATLQDYKEKDAPFFHLAYYFGPHYPYDKAFGDENEPAKDRYQRTLSAFDKEVGSLLDWMQREDFLKKTAVIITSDHGEEFEETGRSGHATRLSMEQIRVPLLLIDQTGSSLTAPANHLEIAPFFTALMEGAGSYTKQPNFLANCGYDHPRGYALLDKDGRTDFSYRDGYLAPIPGPDGTLATKEQQQQAASRLIQYINNGKP